MPQLNAHGIMNFEKRRLLIVYMKPINTLQKEAI